MYSYKTGAGYSVEDNNETFRCSDGISDVDVNFIVTL